MIQGLSAAFAYGVQEGALHEEIDNLFFLKMAAEETAMGPAAPCYPDQVEKQFRNIVRHAGRYS